MCKAATSLLQPLGSSTKRQKLHIIHYLFKAATSLFTTATDFRPLGDRLAPGYSVTTTTIVRLDSTHNDRIDMLDLTDPFKPH